MSRVPRAFLVFEDSTNHCTWRSHGHDPVLDSEEARREFLAFVRKYKEKYGIEILSYCLMGTHPHVMCRATKGQKAFSTFCLFARSLREALMSRRPDLVNAPFIGDGVWIASRIVACGLSPPV